MKLTQEQLAALIAQVFANLIAAGKDPSTITQDDIMTELNTVIETNGTSGGEPAAEPATEPAADPASKPDDEGKGGNPAITPEFITQVLEALKACQ